MLQLLINECRVLFMSNRLFPMIISSCLLAGCAGSDNDDSDSRLTLSLTDGAIDFAEQVNLEISGVELKSNSDVHTFNFDPRTINLLDLQGSQSEALFSDEVLPAGDYQWVRLKVESASIVLTADGGELPLTIPSADQTGFKLVSGFTLPANASANFTLDFDVRKSITVTGPTNNLSYKLRPTMRLVNNIEIGHLGGSVEGTLCDAEANMAVYAYEGHDATVNQEGSENSPVASSLVSEALDYEIGYLVTGNYTITLACIADIDTVDMSDDNVSFIGTQNATVTAKQTGSYSF
jgi:hypothetical protein